MGLNWLSSDLVCEGLTIRPSLSSLQVSDDCLPDVCLRMHMILDTIEFPRCEGRLMNVVILVAMEFRIQCGL
ncbi:MAG: hypothetical protein FJ267_15685 [Planctomycetes bacterium]|nr:hypothetical protein [Planctomycetota bacterium]